MAVARTFCAALKMLPRVRCHQIQAVRQNPVNVEGVLAPDGPHVLPARPDRVTGSR